MKLPRRRSSRPRGRARLALAGDFPDTAESVTEALQAIPPAPWHGATMPLSALRGEDRYPRSDFRPAPVAAPRGQHPYPPAAGTREPDVFCGADLAAAARPFSAAPPAAVLRMPQSRAVMTVNPPRPGGPGPTPQALEVVRYLRAKVTILKRRGHVDRISQDKLAMLPAMRQLNRRTTARLIVDEAAELLRCGGEPR